MITNGNSCLSSQVAKRFCCGEDGERVVSMTEEAQEGISAGEE